MADHAVKIEDVLPAQVHGCEVKVGLGPYPPDQPRSHRKAMYAELVPFTPLAKARLKRMNRERILAMVPLTPEGATLIEAEPNGQVAEKVALDAVREASKLAKGFNDA